MDGATVEPQADASSSGGEDDPQTAYDIIFVYVFPWIGVIIGNMMYAAPWKDVLDASLTGDLGVLNPLPWAFKTGNTFGWYVHIGWQTMPRDMTVWIVCDGDGSALIVSLVRFV